MPMKFSDLNPPATDEETYRWHTPILIARMRRSREWELKREKGPMARLRRLAYAQSGDKRRFTRYVRPQQMSALVSAVSVITGARFSCAVERSLIDDAPCAVVVTLVSRATQGTPSLPPLVPDEA